jgi:hypothetical protein
MTKLTNKEKDHITKTITEACGGTPLQPNAEFAGGYLGTVIIGLLENWDEVRKGLGLPPTKSDKVVYNSRFGGFGISRKAYEMYCDITETVPSNDRYAEAEFVKTLERNDPILVHIVEVLGEEANGPNAELKLESVAGYRGWTITNYDGKETVNVYRE